jgi:predicted hotdog family 3-hydroxylacyl-ACP dehydratase
MNATLAVPPGGGCFEGHFPSRPIFPGVALLDLALGALAGSERGAAPLRGVVFARLRQLVAPGDRLELTARTVESGQVRIDVHRGSELVANAQLALGTPGAPPPGAIAPEPVNPGPSAAADLDALLPHRPPMRLIASIVRETAEGLVCMARVPPGCGLAHDGVASALAGVEAAAQAAALWEAVRRSRQGPGPGPGSGPRLGSGPRIGYLVAIRDLTLFAGQVAVDAPMLASVQLEAAAPPLTHYRIETWIGAKLLLRGTIATYLGSRN